MENSRYKLVISIIMAYGLSFLGCLATLIISNEANAQSDPLENARVYRTRLYFKTADISDAGTDDPVFVQVNSTGERFYLDSPLDDRERPYWNAHDIVLGSVSRVRDIQYLTIQKEGTDMWCFDDIRLYINDNPFPVFSMQYSASNPLCIDGNDGLRPFVSYSYNTLRSSANWTVNDSTRVLMCTVPDTLTRDSMVSRIEGIVGDVMSDVSSSTDMRRLYWGGKKGDAYVEISQGGTNTINVDLDLMYELPDWANPEIDVDCKIDVNLAGNAVEVTARDIDVTADGDDVLDWLTLGIQTIIVDDFNSDLDKMTEGLEQSFSFDLYGLLANVSVDNSANVDFVWTMDVWTKLLALCLA